MAKRPVFGLIGIPSFGKVSIEWALNFHHIGVGLAVYVQYMYVKNKRVDIAKNELCQAAVDQNTDWVFLLDDDVHPPQNTLMKMIKLAFGPPYLDIINGVYWSKSEPAIPLMFRGDMKGSVWNWHQGDLIKIDAAGMGCTLIKTKVLKAIPKPWFSVDYTYNPLDPTDIPPESAPGATEDLYFYKKAREAGFQTWADTSIQCLHEDRSGPEPIYYGLMPDMPQAKPASDIVPRGDKLILDIGAGEHSPYFQEGAPVRLDFDENNKPDILCDWNNIPEPDQKYDIVFASHALEHNPHTRVLNVLREWTRVLKVGGELRLVVPNLQFPAERILKDEQLNTRDMWILYSAQKDEYDYHKTGFTPRLLKSALETLGCLDDIRVWTADGNWSNWQENPGNYNIIATAKKVKHLGVDSIVDKTLQEYSPEDEKRKDKYEYGDPVMPLIPKTKKKTNPDAAKSSLSGVKSKKGINTRKGKKTVKKPVSKSQKKRVDAVKKGK